MGPRRRLHICILCEDTSTYTNMSISRSVDSYLSIVKNMKVYMETCYHGFLEGCYMGEVGMGEEGAEEIQQKCF